MNKFQIFFACALGPFAVLAKGTGDAQFFDVAVTNAAVERVDFGPDAAGGYAEFEVAVLDDAASNAVLRVAYATHPNGLSPKGDFWRETAARYLGDDVDLPILPANIDRYELYKLDHLGTYRAKLLQGLVRYVRFSLDSTNGVVEIRNFRLVNDKVHSEGEREGSFTCSDSRLTRLWEASVRTCELAAIPSYTATHVSPPVVTLPYLADGAKRDRLVWSGDLWFAERSFFYGFRPKAPYLRGSLDMLAANQTPEGYIQASPWPEQPPPKAGEWGPFGSDEFACWFVPVMQDYYLHTADLETVRRHYGKVVKLMSYLAAHQRADGIFEQRKETCKHAAGLVFGGTSLHHRSYMNILLWKTYMDAAYLSDAVGASDGAKWRSAADVLAKSIRKSFWKCDKGFFAFSEENAAMGFEANALALATRFATNDEAAKIMPLMTRTKHGKFQQLMARGKFEYGDARGGLKALEDHYWYKLLEPGPDGKEWQGVVLTAECMHLIRKGWGDEAHPDTCVASLYTNYILGITPIEPGFKVFRFAPLATDLIDSASGEVPTPHGVIKASWWHENGKLRWSVTPPEGTHCEYADLATGDASDPRRIAEIAAALPERPKWAAGLPKANPAKAAMALAEPIPDCSDELYLLFKKTGNRAKYQEVYFARTANLKTLAAMAEKTGEKKYVDRVAEYLEAICSERSWKMPAHDRDLACFNGKRLSIDLGAAQRACDLATTLRHVGDKLPATLVDRVRSEMERRVFAVYRNAAKSANPGDGSEDKYGCWWFFGNSNWNAVCHSQVVRAALETIGDRNDRALFVEAAERGSRFFLDGFLDDGYCTEGSGYWKYGYGNFLELVEAVAGETGGKVDLSRQPRAREAFEYGFGFRMTGDFTPDFADGGCQVPPIDYLKLGVKFWPELRPLLSGKLEPRTWFPCAQVYIGRTPSFSFAVKGGNNAELHNHNDVGSWNLVVGDVLIAGDPGLEMYTGRTFSPRRYESKVLNSFGHPVPVVAGELQGTGGGFAAKVVSTNFSDTRDEVVLDLSGAYPDSPRKLLRTIVFDRSVPKAIVRDDVAFDAPAAFESAFVARYAVETGADGKSLFVTGKGRRGGSRGLRVDIKAAGGDWTLAEEVIENPGFPSAHRVAVRFKEPVREATVEFEMTEVPVENKII